MNPGDTIGPYRLLAAIGRGAMGEVWRARDQRLDRLVALKLLPAALAGDPERRARMLREARAAAAVPHPSVVTLYDIVEHAGCDVLVMELVEGETVAEALRAHGPPPLERGLTWLCGVADALAGAHARKILHRDIKAANVMVTRDGGVKVLDFGLAKLVTPGDESGLRPLAPLTPPDLSMSDTVSSTPVPRTTAERVALDATMPSEPGAVTDGGSLDAYATRAGSLLGTPMYMAPEQLAGAAPDERTEVFSLGVLAYEVVTGKPPYHARTLDELFAEISRAEPPRLAEPIPPVVADLVARALRHDREQRFPTMAAVRDALVAAREQLFRPRAARWPLVLAALAATGALVAGTLWWLGRPPPPRKGDAYVTRALDEYDVFYGDKALSSLRAALRVDPTHPRALAYVILFGGTDADRADAAARGRTVLSTLPAGKDRALLTAALTLEEGGPAAARDALAGATDRELAFWSAELAYRAGAFDLALPIYRELDRTGAGARFRGRIYDHYSSVLIWADEPAAALEVGARYHDAYPGEPDALAVHATTLAIAGQLDPAAALAEEALTLNRSEDTLAGLGKVRALRGELDAARQLYAESLAMAPPARRPLRRAALALLAWMQGDRTTADATVAPCLPGGADAAIPQRAACLAVAGAIAAPDDPRRDLVVRELESLAAAATPTRPAYGNPRALAALVRAGRRFTAGGCLGPRPTPPALTADEAAALARELGEPLDFPSAYHVPFFASWGLCERAWLAAATGERDAAIALLDAAAARAPGRWWLLDDLAALRDAPK